MARDITSSMFRLNIGKRARSSTGDEDEQAIDPAIVASGVFVLKDAMDLEHKQYELREMVTQYESATVKDAALYNKIHYKRESSDAAIGEWSTHHATVMGQAVAQLKIALPNAIWPERSDRVEADALPIPSNLPSSIQNHKIFKPFTRTELKLRQGMANDLLK
ncbi:hypothetical protein BC629DRAFT_1598052 [Irpex lacteus]|nr:hypothetical protein BC629DRAFT_1598052 [Irpex lacteus]